MGVKCVKGVKSVMVVKGIKKGMMGVGCVDR